MRRYMKWLALLLSLAMLLSGCVALDMQALSDKIVSQLATPFSEMEYQQPDIDELEALAQTCCEHAQTEKDVDALLEDIWAFFSVFNSFYTNYNLANIYYFKDITDTYWETEYNFCTERAARADAALDELYYALADCPLREELEATDTFGEGFFDDYTGESIWDDTFTGMIDKQAQLEADYYELCAQAQQVPAYSEEFFTQYGTKMADLFVKLVALRQEIAAYAGYEDYPTFAYEFYHQRDYAADEAERYLEEIGEQLVPLYRQANLLSIREHGWEVCDKAQTLAYVQSTAEAMGGTVKTAFQMMTAAELYDITYSDKKYDVSFEVYLPDYECPYVFVNPQGVQRDKLTFVHEFGHFCNDYASYGMKPGVDVAEVFSQGMEYLSLCYVDDAKKLEQVKMLDSLNVFVEQAAYALFEHRVYALKGEELTTENVHALYEQICTQFGFDMWVWDSRDYVLVNHFFMAPMYVVSYVVSNDVALQIYQLEKQEQGAGLVLYEKELTTAQESLLAFCSEAELESPFAQGRIEKIRKTLEEILK